MNPNDTIYLNQNRYNAKREREGTNQLTKKVTNTTIRDISNQRIECKRPRHRILQRFFELIHFEVFVSDALLIDAHTLNG